MLLLPAAVSPTSSRDEGANERDEMEEQKTDIMEEEHGDEEEDESKG